MTIQLVDSQPGSSVGISHSWSQESLHCGCSGSSEQAAMDLINGYLAAAPGWRKVETPRGNLEYVRSVDDLETGSIEYFGG